jgi:tetratricopeptide (TPR) repeat protein
MSSIIEGYNYDIFISYRQKDNKGDRWVSEFVDTLKTELESTFKEEISVYFDIDPHDGLLETHDVDASLKEKLKCLVFIPIISRTYCDSKSFAWEHEFKAFVEQASKDQFGLKVKLPNGNVASRILPVRIHDLDIDDIKQCESFLGGVLRGVEFIYKEPGVNKPLTSNDDEKKNLNNTKYRIQINKVANALKEIINGLSALTAQVIKEKDRNEISFKEVREDEKKIDHWRFVKASKWKLLSILAIVAIIVIAAIFAYPKIFKRDTLEKLRSSGSRISVAVMPFQNMTNDTTWNVWQMGIQENLILYLSNFSEELIVRQTESVNALILGKNLTNNALITPSLAKTISQKLEANVFILGSIQQAGPKLRLNAKLIDTKTDEVLRPFEIDGPYREEKIFRIIDSLRKKVTDFLVISKLRKELNPELQSWSNTNSLDAYRYTTEGMNAFSKFDYSTSIKLFSQAFTVDSNFFAAALYIAQAYSNLGFYDKAKEVFLKVYKKRDQSTEYLKMWMDYYHAYWFEMPFDVIKYLRKLLEYDDQSPTTYWLIGDQYYKLYQFDKAIPEFEKCLEIYDKWGVKPWWAPYYSALGYCYYKTGHYKEEKKLYKKAELDFPDDPVIIYRQTVLALTEGDTKAANEYIDKYISIRKDKSASEAAIADGLANIYSQTDIPEKAEQYYRKALSLEPENSYRLNKLAYFLIDNDRNVTEGMDLIDKALKLTPDNSDYLHTKGWGLYRQQKPEEALKILQKSWDLRPTSIFSMQIYYHLDSAKKAVANQKKN